MEDSDDDIPLRVKAKSACWYDTADIERETFDNFSSMAIETSCPATSLVTSASCAGRKDVVKAPTGNIEVDNPFEVLDDKMKLALCDSTDEANPKLCAKKTNTKKMKIQEERKANDIMTCFQRRSGIKAELTAKGSGVSSSSSSGSGIKRTASGTALNHSSQTS